VEIIDTAGRYADPGDAGAGYVEHLRRSDLSLGTYCLRAGAVDRQDPHAEDEVYVVTAGRARFTGGRFAAVGRPADDRQDDRVADAEMRP
jgi:hypothetical protein